MEQNLAVALIFIAIVIAATILIVAMLNYRIKRRLISSGLADESTIKTLNKLHFDFRLDTLKWGVILLFAGAGLIVLNFVPYNAESVFPYGLETVFVAAGLLTYFFISRKINPSA